MKIIFLLLLIFISNFICYKNGHSFYKYIDETKQNKVFDLSFYLLPKLKLSSNVKNIINWLTILILIVPLFINKSTSSNWKLSKEIIKIFIPVAIIRAITINLTILPPNSKCDLSDFSINELVHGHCYDKLFSGHLAITLICMYVYLNNNIVSKYYAMASIMFVILYMLISKGHYTNDLVFSFFVVYFVIKENLMTYI